MIRTIKIENFKSVRELELELGRVTVLIGANGAGKSNILEGIAFASAAAADKLDNEFLVSRGIRVFDNARLMMSGFDSNVNEEFISISLTSDLENEVDYTIYPEGEHEDKWESESVYSYISKSNLNKRVGFAGRDFERLKSNSKRLKLNAHTEDFEKKLTRTLGGIDSISPVSRDPEVFLKEEKVMLSFSAMKTFLIYAPENRELRTFSEEGQILPLGIRGEGLFRLLHILSQQDNGAKLQILKEKLQLIDWFEDFSFQKDAMPYERRLLLRDRHLSEDLAYFDQRSANEGFLFLLFYFCLFLSNATPPFFAIDNIDSSLNPKLCERLVRELTQLAADNNKQVILTTHNPAVLDGLDLTDPEQKLYVVRRNLEGETIVSRVFAPEVQEGQETVPLSEAFLRGYLGGLPNSF